MTNVPAAPLPALTLLSVVVPAQDDGLGGLEVPDPHGPVLGTADQAPAIGFVSTLS